MTMNMILENAAGSIPIIERILDLNALLAKKPHFFFYPLTYMELGEHFNPKRPIDFESFLNLNAQQTKSLGTAGMRHI